MAEFGRLRLAVLRRCFLLVKPIRIVIDHVYAGVREGLHMNAGVPNIVRSGQAFFSTIITRSSTTTFSFLSQMNSEHQFVGIYSSIHCLPTEIIAGIFKYAMRGAVLNGESDTLAIFRVCRRWTAIANRVPHLLKMIALKTLNDEERRMSLPTNSATIPSKPQRFATVNDSAVKEQLLKIQRKLKRQLELTAGTSASSPKDLVLDIGVHDPSFYAEIEHILEKGITSLNSFIEDSYNGIFLSLLPKLKPEQYEGLTHLRFQLPYNTDKCDFVPDITLSTRFFSFPNLKVLHFTCIEPHSVNSHFLTPNVTTLIFEGNEGFCNSIVDIIEIVVSLPLLETLVIDIDLADLSEIEECRPNSNVRHLTLGGFSLFEDCDSNPEYMGWQNELDVFKLLHLFPYVTSLTLREISMMGCGIPSIPIPTIETLRLVYGINQ